VRLRRRLLRRGEAAARPPVGGVDLGDLDGLTPISDSFGDDRGQPVDRYYIDRFLSRHSGEIGYAPSAVSGRVLEIGDAAYATRYADPAALESIDVLDASPANPKATVIGDLEDGSGLEAEAYDCVICTQTLLLIFDLRAAIATLHSILKPSGRLLATVPGISQICQPDMEAWGDHWRFTSRLIRRLFQERFAAANLTVESYGNVLSAAAFLQGLAVKDLRREELDLRDPEVELLIAIKAVK
jgi:SAM-dependent methyltransferase